MSDKTYTEDELKAAVAAAVKPLEDRLGEFEGKEAEDALAAKLAEVRAELEPRVTELQQALDVKEAELTTVKQEFETFKSELQTIADEAAEEAAKEARKAERIAQVAELVTYKEEFIAEKADWWASQSDEEFAAFLASLEAAGVKKGEESKKDDEIPEGDTTLTTSRETASGESTPVRALLDLQRAGIDARRI